MNRYKDLGLAVANSLAGLMVCGARQFECTINCLGEYADNYSLKEVVMMIKTHHDLFRLDVGIDAQKFLASSLVVSQITGFVMRPNQAVVNVNAFAYASSIHQDGALKARDTYETMRAEDAG